MEHWHLWDEDCDPGWQQDFERGQEIGIIIVLLAGSLAGMLGSALNHLAYLIGGQ